MHTHYHEEKCYEDEIFFYHLGCHQWVPSAELAQGLPHGKGGLSHGGGGLPRSELGDIEQVWCGTWDTRV